VARDRAIEIEVVEPVLAGAKGFGVAGHHPEG
jgi:hypothetical protein